MYNFNFSILEAQSAINEYALSSAMTDSALSVVSIRNVATVPNTEKENKIGKAENVYSKIHDSTLSAFYKKINYSIKDRIDYYVRIINNSLEEDSTIHTAMQISEIWPNEDNSNFSMNSMFERCMFTVKQEKIDTFPRIGSKGGGFVNDVFDEIYEFITDEVRGVLSKSVMIAKLKTDDVGVNSLTLAGQTEFPSGDQYKNKRTYIGSFFSPFTISDEFSTTCRWVNPYTSLALNNQQYNSIIIYPYTVLMDLFRFFSLLKNIQTLNIELILYQTMKESFFNIKLNETALCADEKKLDEEWPKKAIKAMMMMNSIVYSVTSPVYTYKEISNLRNTIVNGYISNDNNMDPTKSIHIPNLIFAYKNAICSIDKTFSTNQDGTNGIFSMYSTVYAPDELTPFDKITLDEIRNISGCISGQPISLTNILNCIDYIFYSWLTNIKTINLQFNICHSNCHSNRYGLNASEIVCVCGQWKDVGSVQEISSQTPINRPTRPSQTTIGEDTDGSSSGGKKKDDDDKKS